MKSNAEGLRRAKCSKIVAFYSGEVESSAEARPMAIVDSFLSLPFFFFFKFFFSVSEFPFGKLAII